jgi:hypothetical protein
MDNLPEKKTKVDRLTEKNMAFIDHYLANGMNATESYLSVYKDVTRESAGVEGSRVLSKPSAAAYLAVKKSEIAKRYEIKLDYVVPKLFKLIENCEAEGEKFAMIKGLELLCRLGGLLQANPMVNVQSTGEIKIDFGGYAFNDKNAIEASDSTNIITDVDFEDTDNSNE